MQKTVFINKAEGVSPDAVRDISMGLSRPTVLARVFAARGCSSAEDARKKFLQFDKSGFRDPFLFKQMDKAVQTIREVMNRGETIVIYGDYDVDGTMATSVLFMALSGAGASVGYYIPDRHSEGYGLNVSAIDKIKAEFNPSLIITVDCGITSKDEVAYAYEKGIKVIVTDHHEPPEELPLCEAILDAKVPGETYPFRELCGTGVAGKLAWAVCGYEVFRQYVDLIALATVADIVPLVDENYTLVKAGLIWLNKMPMRQGFAALSQYAKKPEELVNAYMLGYRYGPMINACGRLADASESVRLMTTQNAEEAEHLAHNLNTLNERRREMEHDTVEECMAMLREDTRPLKKSVILWSNNWDSGVIGIAASRIQEKYNCPIILFAYDAASGVYHGSCRSIAGINIYGLLCSCAHTIKKFGGHEAAAGLTVEAGRIDEFKKAFEAITEAIPDDCFAIQWKHDGIVAAKDITVSFANDLNAFEPCGAGNPRPKFFLHRISLKNIRVMGKNLDSFKCLLYDETARIEAVAFGLERPDEFSEYDAIVSPTTTVFNGRKEVRCNILCLQRAKTAVTEISLDNTAFETRLQNKPIEILGLPTAKLSQFKSAGIETIDDLISYIPRDYKDYRFDKTLTETAHGEKCCIIGTIVHKDIRNDSKHWTKATVRDKNGDVFYAYWYNQTYVYKFLEEGRQYIFCGKMAIYSAKNIQMAVEEYDMDVYNLQRLNPVYKAIRGMSKEYLNNCIFEAFKKFETSTDYLEKSIVERFGLLPELEAKRKLHRPMSDKDIRDGQFRMAFDNLFRFNFILKDRMKDAETDTVFRMKSCNIWEELRKRVPYSLTNDQEAVLARMYEIMSGGKRLNALIQGDVGTGKTIVAFMTMAAAFENCFQSCIVAPTEVLARQHYEALKELVDGLGINVGFLANSTKAKEKRAVLEGLKNGTMHMVVGTHAVLQDKVEFVNLGVVIIDEQHRFGVAQRDKLLQGENKPHLITMSATPIPRTLSMAMYGDHIEVCNIKTKPAGRKDIITKILSDDEEVNKFMLSQIEAGHQCYVVCPIIEDSESEKMENVESVDKTVKKLQKWFSKHPQVVISNVTGRMKQAAIAAEVDKFAKGESHILISTTIIEVGVNVPNATVMVIKSSERFGLAQAHQLRGRVGRGDAQSYCILQPAPDDPKAEILAATTDGFEIAHQDMLLRGAGDYLGTSQSGSNKDVMLMLAEPDLYREIGKVNDEIFADPARFAKYKYILDEV